MNNEFKKSKKGSDTVYTLESASSGATGSGSISSNAGVVGGVHRRDNLIVQDESQSVTIPVKQKPRQGPLKPQTGAGAHRDKKKEQSQGKEKHKKPYMEDLKSRLNVLKEKLSENSELVQQFMSKGKESNPLTPEEKSKLEAELEQLETELAKDPDYEYSDDHRVWTKGNNLTTAIRNIKQRLAQGSTAEDHSTMSQGYGRGSGSTGQAFAGRMKGAIPETAPKGWEGTVKAMKKHKDEIDNPWALAHWMKNKGYKSHKKNTQAEGAEFGAYYYEKLAQQVFDQFPDLDDEDKILNVGYAIAKKDLGSRAQGIFHDEDFPSDFVSAYSWLKKQGVAEGSLEEIDRRGFLKGMGAAAVAGTGLMPGLKAQAQMLKPTDDEMRVFWLSMDLYFVCKNYQKTDPQFCATLQNSLIQYADKLGVDKRGLNDLYQIRSQRLRDAVSKQDPSWLDHLDWAYKNKEAVLNAIKSQRPFESVEQGVAEDSDNAVADFLAKGGKIQYGKTHKPRKAEKWQGSAHIGSSGGRGSKGRVTGLGANTKNGNKPVVSVEDSYTEHLSAMMAEKLNPQAPVDAWVQDFQKADPNRYHQFKNKTKEKKAQMASAAHYAANEPSKKK